MSGWLTSRHHHAGIGAEGEAMAALRASLDVVPDGEAGDSDGFSDDVDEKPSRGRATERAPLRRGQAR